MLGRNLSKNLEYANSMGIPNVLIVGQKDLAENKVTLKNMETGEEKKLSVQEVLEEFK